MCKISLFRINNCYELQRWPLHDVLYVLVPSPSIISLCKKVGNTVIWNNLSLYCILVPYSLQCEWISLNIITLTTRHNDLLIKYENNFTAFLPWLDLESNPQPVTSLRLDWPLLTLYLLYVINISIKLKIVHHILDLKRKFEWIVISLLQQIT